MNVIPIGPRVLIKPQKEQERTASGIYIPESAQEEKKQGVVEAVGQTEDGKDLPLKKGDRVVYGGYSDTEIEAGNEKYIVVEYKDIVAKLE